MRFIAIEDKAITTGGVINIPVDMASGYPECLNEGYRLTGTQTLTSDYELTPLGTPTINQKVIFFNQSSITLDGNDFIIFGETIPVELANKDFIIECIYNGTVWEHYILPSFSESSFITTSQLIDSIITTIKLNNKAVTKDKVEDITQGSIWIGSAGARPIELTIGAANRFLQANGTTASWVAMSGDATLAAGVLTIANNAVTTVKILDGAVTVAKLETKLKQEVMHFEMESTVAMLRTAYFKMPWDCTVTEVDVRVSQVLAGGDLTVTPMDNGGTTMTGGPITIPLATAIGSGVSQAISGNNTFTAGQFMRIQTSGAAVTDGLVSISVTVLRT